MNERIRELAKQSYKEVIETNDYNGDAYTVREFDQEKFAELIVKECADVAFLEANSRKTQRAVLQHFGVEE